MILDEYVNVGISWKNKKWYEDLGYNIPTVYDAIHKKYVVKKGTKIKVKPNELSKNSHEKIHVQCDYCGKENYITYQSYYKHIEKFGDYACNDCKGSHIKQTFNRSYNVDNISQLDEIKDKKKQKSLERYGTEYISQSDEVKDKIRKTNMERYGVSYTLQSANVQEKSRQTIEKNYNSIDEFYHLKLEKAKHTNQERYGTSIASKNSMVIQKMKNTNMMRYGHASPMGNTDVQEKAKETSLLHFGVEHPAQSQEVQQKIKQTMLKKYGCEYPMQSDDILEKSRATLSNIGQVETSAQQVYLYRLYGGELNYPFKRYNLDIYDDDKQIAVEYSGGGHDLSVKLGMLTQEEFDQKELTRKAYIKRAGIRLIEIITPHDLIPSDKILLQMYCFAEDYFNNTGHTWISFYPEDNKYRNAEFQEMDGSFFNFGELRKISRKEVT